jgi:hypothetical protein
MNRDDNPDKPTSAALCYTTPPIVALVPPGPLIDASLLEGSHYLTHTEVAFLQVHLGFWFQGELVLRDQTPNELLRERAR